MYKTYFTIIIMLIITAYQSNAQMQSDTSDAYWEVVLPLAAAQDIDMGEVLVSGQKDSVVSNFVQNVGSWKFRVDSIYFRGADASAFSMVSGFPKYEVAAGRNHAGEFRFTPARVGNHSAEIVIITQADTLVQNIIGEGIQPQLAIIEEFIDFGKVNVGSQKDTLQAVTIKNIGTAPLNISNTNHGKPNDADFTTLAGGGAFTLQPGDTCKMDLSFSPSDAGRTSGTLEFHYNGVGSPAIVQLFGEGVNNNPQILANAEAFPDLVCHASALDTISISNPGGKDLLIEDLKLLGDDAGEFAIISTVPITIEPDSTKEIIIQFNPTSPGNKSVDIEIKSNADPDSLLTLTLNARKDRVSLIPENDVIDLGYLCPNETKDTTLTIENTGTLQSGGHALLTGNLTCTNSEFILDLTETHELYLTFTGLPDIGAFTETITITDSICGLTNQVQITGEVALPSISAQDITITTLIGTTKQGTILLENNSKRSVTIANPPVISAPFEYVGNPFPITIPAGGSYSLAIRYSPDDDSEDNITLTFEGEPCNVNGQAEISGIPASSTTILQAPEYEAYPGDEIEIRIILNNQENLALSGAKSLKTDLQYNSTLLWPLDYPQQKIDETTAKITLDNLPVDVPVGEPLSSVRFKVGLGDAEGCDLLLSNAESDNGLVDISLINGKFRLLGICREGGTRLINNSSFAGITSISPNPSHDKLDVGLSLTEAGYTELAIYNVLGERVKTLYSGVPSISSDGLKQDISADITELATGQYIVILKTPTYVESRSITIFK